jgi:uncharacterized protein YdaU (DUF1376 family)
LNYYPHHINDFNSATRHLDRLERSIYRDLIELYYETEQQLTNDLAALCRKIIARSNEEATAVEQVLNEFFTETPTGWFHSRCEEEIDRYRSNNSQKAEAGRASAAKRQAQRQRAANGESTHVEQTLNERSTNEQRNPNVTPTNQEPITNNHKPIIKNKAKSQPEKPADVSDKVWSDFLQIRKAKRSPMTDTALQQIRAEADKAGVSLQTALEHSCARGWQGFKAGWISELTAQNSLAAKGETAYQRKMRERWEEATGQETAAESNIIDITPLQNEHLRIA